MLACVYSRGDKAEMYGENDIAVVGEIKLELDVSDGDEAPTVSPIVITPESADDPFPNLCRRSGRAVKKRSLLLPGELGDGVVTGVGKYHQILPKPAEDGAGNNDAFTISRVIEVKPYVSPPRTKRTYRRRKPQQPANEESRPAVVGNSPESVDKILGQLVDAFCGTDGHPANCEDCKNRVDAIRALLQSSGKCCQVEM